MKKFLIKIILFLFPIIIIGFSMEMLLRQIPNQYVLKNNYATANSHTIETLILGSSHSYYGINPEYFTKPCFNSANISQSLNFDLALLKRYETELSNLKTVILPISYFSFFEKLDESNEFWRVKNYTIYYDLDVSDEIVENSEVLSIKLGDNLSRMYSYYLSEDFKLDCSETGWGNSFLAEESLDLNKTGISTAKRHTIDDLSLLNQTLSTLKTMIELCEKRNINVILFTPPAYKSYSENLNPNQLELTKKNAIEIANSFENCRYINLMEDSSFTEKDFFDADHLNNLGAKKLSILLNNIITNL